MTIVRLWLVAASLVACQRASTPAPPPAAANPLPLPTASPAVLSTITAPSRLVETPAIETPGPAHAVTTSPTGLAYFMEAGTRFPTRTLTPTITPDDLGCLPAQPDEIAQVQWVTDGDTIVVELQGRPKSVRYLGVDAPAYLPNSRFIGPMAYQHNRQLVEGQIVSLYRDGADSDETGQLLRYVVTHGVFVNLELVRLGLASTSASAEGGQACAASLRQAEQSARAARVGLWAGEVVAAEVTSPATLPAPSAPATSAPASSVPAPSPAPTLPATTPLPATATLTLAPGITPSPTFTGAPASPSPTTPTQVAPSATSQAATATPGADTGVHITDVQYNGTTTNQERDEYVEITNEGDSPVTITGWRLISKNTSISFTFPSFTLQPGVSCFVYTNQVDEDSCVSDSFRQASGIWDPAGDCAQIFDANSVMQNQFCY